MVSFYHIKTLAQILERSDSEVQKQQVQQKFPILRFPKELVKIFLFLLLAHAAETMIMDATSFLLQLSKSLIVDGVIIGALIIFGLYHARDPLSAFFQSLFSEQMLIYEEAELIQLGKVAGNILFLVKGKVTKRNEEHGFDEKMTSNEILTTLRKYVQLLWSKQLFWFKNAIKVLSTAIMLIGFVIVTNVEVKNTLVFYLITLIGVGIKVLFSFKWVSIKNKRRGASRKASLLSENALQDILQVEPFNTDHAKFMIDNFVKSSSEGFNLRRTTQHEVNIFRIIESVLLTFVTFGIIAITLLENGIMNANLETLTSAIALVAIYNQVLRRSGSLVDIFYDYREIQEEEKIRIDDFNAIMAVYEVEKNKQDAKASKLITFTVNPFEVQHKADGGNRAFTLINEQTIQLVCGDFVMFTGATGAGKTTLLSLVTQNTYSDKFEPTIETESEGVAKSIMHQVYLAMGTKTLLSEITLGKPEYDREKLLYILENLHLLDEFAQKNDDVFALLNSTTKTHFSAGQLQRLAIARTLYNLSDDIQIVAFDEATNNLNDDIAYQVLRFIASYCKDKLVLFSTHQIEVCKRVATKQLSFTPTGINTYTVASVN